MFLRGFVEVVDSLLLFCGVANLTDLRMTLEWFIECCICNVNVWDALVYLRCHVNYFVTEITIFHYFYLCHGDEYF